MDSTFTMRQKQNWVTPDIRLLPHWQWYISSICLNGFFSKDCASEVVLAAFPFARALCSFLSLYPSFAAKQRQESRKKMFYSFVALAQAPSTLTGKFTLALFQPTSISSLTSHSTILASQIRTTKILKPHTHRFGNL